VEYAYARACLLQYARWMAAHEAPYLDRPERLEFPTETWAAQEIRKAAVLEFAARHVPGPGERQTLFERASFFFDEAMTTLSARPTARLTRPVVLLLAYGFQRPVRDLGGVGLLDQPRLDFGQPSAFVPYKQRIVRRALLMGAASAVGGVLLIATLLLR
jgi:hypothetical protein